VIEFERRPILLVGTSVLSNDELPPGDCWAKVSRVVNSGNQPQLGAVGI
jgi:hypothetical protein